MTTLSANHEKVSRLPLLLVSFAAMIEGFDLQAAGVAIPDLGPAFGLEPRQIGWFLSSVTIGLIPGALIGGRIADAWGRRAGLVISLLTFGIFSLATAFASNFEQLVTMRILTGIGLGGALPNLVNIAAEAAAPEKRGRAVAMMYAGIPLGGAIASAVAMMGWGGGNWRIIFILGGLMPLLIAPLAYLVLPPLNVPKDNRQTSSAAWGRIFGRGMLGTTVLLWMSFFFGLVVVYLLLNWLPHLLVTRGLEKHEASLVQMLFNLGGVIGGIFGGRMLDRENPVPPVALCFAGASVALVLLGILPASLGFMIFGGTIVGGAILCVQAILYGAAPQCYPYAIRGTGIGIAVAVGRVGSIVGPLVAGMLIAASFTPTQMMLIMVPVTLLAGLLTCMLLARHRNLPATETEDR